MILHTVIPTHLVAAGMERDGPAPIEVEWEGVRLLMEPVSPGQGRIVRLISTDPADYLNPAWQPGRIVAFPVPLPGRR